jgi:hypothetical protein
MYDKVAIGTRVRVMDTNRRDLGLGTYQGEVAFDDDDNEVSVAPNADDLCRNPKILLDTGKIIYGFECWWSETDNEMEKLVEKMAKVTTSS